ncbi:acetylglutamate kinase [Jiulongibacter sediminis]|jgi:acetylglutamate kinase|uniref:acetylglutamate kinase n=1 Tax=Jiulongibacter sediminis TaxID=1605367 RepID=UPI0026F06FB3|nr:acetylglutamate kinase [Jiulongibacter sediminis]
MTVNVIKIGGNVIDNEAKLQKFIKNFATLKDRKILVHGGGKIATKIAADLHIETKMVDGRRITDEPMREVVTMVYGGKVNKHVVSSLQQNGCNAIGLSGADAGVILAQKRPVKEIDYGFVGDIKSVNAGFIESLLNQNITPVFAPLSFDPEHGMLNTNADTQASEVARALSENHEVNLIYCFEKKGVLLNADDDDSVIPKLNPENYEKYKAEGVIYAGMIPKLDNAFAAVAAGVNKVIICEADQLQLAVETGEAGTAISLA